MGTPVKSRLPVRGSIGKSVRFPTTAQTAAVLGVNVQLADGSVPSIATLAALFATTTAQANAGAGASVTSVGLSMPAEFAVADSPVVNAATLTVTLADQDANEVWAGPASGAAAVPGFRALVAADIPALDYVTSVGLSMPGIFAVADSPVTSDGTIEVTLETQDANYVWAGPTSGSAAAPTFRALVSADIPNNAADTTGTAAGLSVTLAIASGGTGETTALAAFNALADVSPAEGDILYYTGSAWAVLAPGTTGYVLTMGSALPEWAESGGGGGDVNSVSLNDDSTTPIYTTAPTSASTGAVAATITLKTQDANYVFAGPTSGSAAEPSFRALVSADIPNNAANTTGTAGGLSTTLAIASGGTGQTTALAAFNNLANVSPAQGDILYYNGSAWAVLAPGTSGYVLTTQGASANPEWAAGGAQATPQMRGATFSGGTLAITTPVNAVPIYVPYDCTITNATLLTQGGTGSCQLDIWKIAYASYPPVLADSIVASAPPKITSGDTYTDSTLTGWTTNLSAGDTLLVVLDSTSTFTEISLFLTLTPTGFVNNGYTNADAIAAVVTQLANPTGTVGLSAVDGVADTFMRSDAAPALSQAIAPTWTGAHTFSASSGTSVTINGNDGANALIVDGNATSGGSYGILVNAGTTSADYAMLVRNQATTYSFMGIYGDGHGFFGGETYDAMQWDTTGNILGISVDTLPSGIDNAYGQTVFGVDGLPEFTLMRGGGGNVYMLGNMYYNGSEWVALNTDASESIVMDGGSIAFQSGPSTTAGDSVTLTNIFVINSTTSPTVQGYGPTAATLVDMTPDYGTFTGTFTGYATSLTGTVGWVRMGKLVMLMFPAVGVSTSNATTFTMTGLPAAIQTTQTVVTSCFPAENDSGGVTAYGTLTSGSGTITFSQNSGTTSSSWTSAGSKGIAVACMVCYFLGD